MCWRYDPFFLSRRNGMLPNRLEPGPDGECRTCFRPVRRCVNMNAQESVVEAADGLRCGTRSWPVLRWAKCWRASSPQGFTMRVVTTVARRHGSRVRRKLAGFSAHLALCAVFLAASVGAPAQESHSPVWSASGTMSAVVQPAATTSSSAPPETTPRTYINPTRPWPAWRAV